MKILVGKWYVALRLKDLCVGIGRPSAELKAEADLGRPHKF
jgi:hypothetical protein